MREGLSPEIQEDKESFSLPFNIEVMRWRDELGVVMESKKACGAFIFIVVTMEGDVAIDCKGEKDNDGAKVVHDCIRVLQGFIIYRGEAEDAIKQQ